MQATRLLRWTASLLEKMCISLNKSTSYIFVSLEIYFWGFKYILHIQFLLSNNKNSDNHTSIPLQGPYRKEDSGSKYDRPCYIHHMNLHVGFLFSTTYMTGARTAFLIWVSTTESFRVIFLLRTKL